MRIVATRAKNKRIVFVRGFADHVSREFNHVEDAFGVKIELIFAGAHIGFVFFRNFNNALRGTHVQPVFVSQINVLLKPRVRHSLLRYCSIAKKRTALESKLQR